MSSFTSQPRAWIGGAVIAVLLFVGLVAASSAAAATKPATTRVCLPAPGAGQVLYVGARGAPVAGDASKAIRVGRTVPKGSSSIVYGSASKGKLEANAVAIAGSAKLSKVACVRLSVTGASEILSAILPKDPDGDGVAGCGPANVSKAQMSVFARRVILPASIVTDDWLDQGCPND